MRSLGEIMVLLGKDRFEVKTQKIMDQTQVVQNRVLRRLDLLRYMWLFLAFGCLMILIREDKLIMKSVAIIEKHICSWK